MTMWMKVDKPRAGSFSFARRRHLFAVERRPLNSLWHVWWILWLRGSELRVKQRGQTDFSQLYCPEPNLGGYLRYFGCFLKVCPRAWWLFKIGGALLAWHIKVYQSSGVEGLLPLSQARVHKSNPHRVGRRWKLWEICFTSSRNSFVFHPQIKTALTKFRKGLKTIAIHLFS